MKCKNTFVSAPSITIQRRGAQIPEFISNGAKQCKGQQGDATVVSFFLYSYMLSWKYEMVKYKSSITLLITSTFDNISMFKQFIHLKCKHSVLYQATNEWHWALFYSFSFFFTLFWTITKVRLIINIKVSLDPHRTSQFCLSVHSQSKAEYYYICSTFSRSEIK